MSFIHKLKYFITTGKKNFKEKYIYNSEHENTFNTIFQLDCPYFMPSKINNNPLRGKISRKEAYNSNDSLVLSEDYSYHVAERASIDNLVVLNQVGSALTFQNREILRSTIGGYFLLPNPMFVYKYYKISVPNSYLNSKTITNYSSDSNNVQTENFSNIYGSDVRIESHSTINSDNQETKINYTYIDSNINNDMYLNNMINMVRDTKYTKNNGTMMTRNDYNSLGLITKTSSAQGVGLLPSLESKIDYTYDLKGNISSASKTGGLPVCYIWGYEYTYPVVKIEGLTYSQFTQSVSTSLLSTIGVCKDNAMMDSYLNTLRTTLNNAVITIYMYDSIMGTLIYLTDPRGITTYYTYDGFGRLICTKDKDGKTIQNFSYHYKP